MNRQAYRNKYGVWPTASELGPWVSFTNNLASYNDRLELEVPKTVQAKCPCCGSRQYVYRNNARVCAYCRSES